MSTSHERGNRVSSVCSSDHGSHERGGRVSSVCSSDPGGHERDGRVSSVCSSDHGSHERDGRVSSVCSSDHGGHERGGRVSSMCSSDPRGHERDGRVSFFLYLCAALILEEIAIDSHDKAQEDKFLAEAQELHLQSLELAKKAFGENNVQTAKHYGNLGRLYQSMHRFRVSQHCSDLPLNKRAVVYKANSSVLY